MSIQGKGRRIDNFGALQSQRGTSLRMGGIDNLVERLGLSVADHQGRGDICFGSDDVLAYVFSASDNSDYSGATIQAIYSYDYGQTWSDPLEVLSETGYGFKDPYLYYNYDSRNWLLACTKVTDADPEEAVIVIGRVSDLFQTVNLATVNQPYAKKNIVGGPIKKVNRYLHIPIYGYENTGGTNTPGYLKSTNSGDQWSDHVELGGSGKARNVYTVHNNAITNVNRSSMFVMVENETANAKGNLYVSPDESSWEQFNLPFVLKNTCDYVDNSGVKTFFSQDRSSLGWNEFCFHTINGYDFTPAETVSGIQNSFRKITVSKSGQVISAINIKSHKTNVGEQVGLEELLLPNKQEVESSFEGQLEIVPRHTTVSDDDTYESRVIRTNNPSVNLFLYGNSTPTGLENIKIEIKYLRTTLLSNTVDITHLFEGSGRELKASVNLEWGYFQLLITNNNSSSKDVALYGDLIPSPALNSSKKESNQSLSVTLDRKHEDTNPLKAGLGKLINISKTGGFYEYSGHKSHIGFSCSDFGPDGNIYMLYRSGSSHKSNDGVRLYMVKSSDYGKTWSEPIMMVDEQSDYDYRGIFFTYDAVSDRYLIMYSVEDSDKSTSVIRVKYCDAQKDPMNIDNYSENIGLPQPFTERNVGLHLYRRGKDNLIVTGWGTDTGESVEDANPCVWYSEDNGETWTTGTRFTDVNANECAYYWKHSLPNDTAEHFLICRPEPESQDAVIIKGDHPYFKNGYTVHSANINIAGGAYVMQHDGYFVIAARNSKNSATDSSGYFAYSIDGLTWSEVEYNGIPYPVQPHLFKTKTGRFFIQGCLQPSNSSVIGYSYLAEYVPPTLINVIKRLEGIDIHAFERYTSIADTESYESHYVKTVGQYLDIRFSRNTSFGDFVSGSGIQVRVTYPLKMSGSQSIDVTDQLDITEGNCIGRIPVYGQYAKVEVTNNTGAEIRIQGFVRVV